MKRAERQCEVCGQAKADLKCRLLSIAGLLYLYLGKKVQKLTRSASVCEDCFASACAAPQSKPAIRLWLALSNRLIAAYNTLTASSVRPDTGSGARTPGSRLGKGRESEQSYNRRQRVDSDSGMFPVTKGRN